MALATEKKGMRKLYPLDRPISKLKENRVVKRFGQYGGISDQRKNNKGRPKSSENVKQVKRIIDQTPEMSVRKIFSDINHSFRATSVYRVFRFYIKVTRYKVPVLQHLKESDVNQRLAFATWMTERVHLL
ncbi:hypothetical protein DPMN_173099 [Dreissena polymorpha]|uniref:Transposase Tc1-like domain-containing protein n=1 Tax=Dreissena polymorpha TaxID=45954 RepID=A0A9D4IDW9_DREPO|nr:hypothetical protein DPMN_173099 [Dreissena polymorpha]